MCWACATLELTPGRIKKETAETGKSEAGVVHSYLRSKYSFSDSLIFNRETETFDQVNRLVAT